MHAPTGQLARPKPMRAQDIVTQRRRGPYRPTIGEDPLERRAVQHIVGTLPERIVYKELLRRGLKEPDDFTFQSGLFGARYERGAAVLDFLIHRWEPPIVLEVQGEYWHTGVQNTARDLTRLARIQQLGWEIHFLLEREIYDADRLEQILDDILEHRLPPLKALRRGVHILPNPYMALETIVEV